ncbi:MAG: PstS family phosphate ABC transporter substrate-binding protein [Coleofasciculus sp. S288]|nr:PstS family phosphate ABC transporter substrate-binding protein [Coleofasciculus sp. S288]
MPVNKKNFKLNRRTLLSAIAAVSATAALAVPAVKSQSPATIKIDGSSTVYPITEAVAEEFQNQKRGSVRVTVGISGTGGGFKKFCSGETDISNASRPIKESEMEACKAAGIDYIELPVAYDALTVVVHPQNTWATSMTVSELKKLWEPGAQGKITKWNQVRSSWPDAPLKLFGPGADSGTFDYFTEEVVGESKASRTDYTPSEDDNVLVQGVSRDRNAIGYFGLAYYEANKSRLKAVAIDDEKGTEGAVLPSPETVNNGTYKPLSRPIYIYVKKAATEKPEVREFVEFYLQNAAKLAEEVAYVPLPAADYAKARERFAKGETGRVALREGL